MQFFYLQKAFLFQKMKCSKFIAQLKNAVIDLYHIIAKEICNSNR